LRGDGKLKESDEKLPRHPLVQVSADRLRKLVLACDPGVLIGSLAEVAALLGVGIVTVQQAARVLEYQGLLVVRRGPGGGYYGARPDDAALERSMAAWLHSHRSSGHEALEMVTLLEGELVAAAACCANEELRSELKKLATGIERCDTAEDRIAFEEDLHDLLFRMTERPLIELLSRVTLRYYISQSLPAPFAGEDGMTAWKAGRRRTLAAILQRDEALVRFEADRHRAETLRRLHATTSDG
jgi:GntR family transcriptional repressor for pyruvate dehydrogenase complex